ncbi:WSC domain containing protein [Rhypophila decipiens]
MTPEFCADFCAVWPYFGVEYGRECFCGMAPTTGSVADPQECNIECAGDPSILCGGSKRLSVYHDDSKPGPQAPEEVGDSVRVGCFTENTPRVLDSQTSERTDTMSLEACSSFCTGFTYWGVEDGQECFCANAITEGSTQTSLDQFNKQCKGAPTELCGGAARMMVYQRPESGGGIPGGKR